MSQTEKPNTPNDMPTASDVLDWINNQPKPFVTAREVTETWSCDEETLLKKLYKLVRSGLLESRSVHERVVCWPAD
jgi:DNA-binding IscR family transcriptional regulator